MKFFKKGLMKKLSLLQRILILKQGNSSFFIPDEDFQFILDSDLDFNELTPLLSSQQAEMLNKRIEKYLLSYTAHPTPELTINEANAAVALKWLIPYLSLEKQNFLITLTLAKIALVKPYQRANLLRSLAKLKAYLLPQQFDNMWQILLENIIDNDGWTRSYALASLKTLALQLESSERDKVLFDLQEALYNNWQSEDKVIVLKEALISIQPTYTPSQQILIHYQILALIFAKKDHFLQQFLEKKLSHQEIWQPDEIIEYILNLVNKLPAKHHKKNAIPAFMIEEYLGHKNENIRLLAAKLVPYYNLDLPRILSSLGKHVLKCNESVPNTLEQIPSIAVELKEQLQKQYRIIFTSLERNEIKADEFNELKQIIEVLLEKKDIHFNIWALKSFSSLAPFYNNEQLTDLVSILVKNFNNKDFYIAYKAIKYSKTIIPYLEEQQYCALLDAFMELKNSASFYKTINYLCVYLAKKYPLVLESYFKKHQQQIQANPTLFLSFANAIHSSTELESLKPILKNIFIANDFSSSLLFGPLSNLFFYLTRTQANTFLQTLKDHFPAPSAIKAFIKIMPDLDEDELIMLIDALLSKTPNEPKLTIVALIQFCELNQKPDNFLFIVSRTNTALTSSVDRISNIVKKALIRYMLAEDNKNISNNKLTLGKVIEDYAMTTKTENPDFIVVKAIANLCNLTNNLECGVFRNN